MSESSADRPAYDCPVSAVEVLRGLHDLQSTGTLCDVVLKGSEGYAAGIPCHRNILIVHSAFFRAAFTGADWKESSQKVFPLHHIDTQTLKELVEYAYTLEISLNGDNVAPVLIAAQFLQMTPVARLCWEYVEKHMCLSNCLAVYALASQHHNPRLAYTALDLVHSNFPRFAQSQEFLQMNEQQLIALIASDEVEVFCEDEVWEAVLRWLEYDRPGRLEHVPAVLQMVRAAFLSDQSCLAYSEVLASAMPPCQSAMAAKELPIEEIENFRPRPSYGAQEVVLCVGGGGGTTVEVFSPSIPAVWCFSDLPISAQSCRAVQLDACTVMVAHFNGCNTLRRDCRYMGPLGEWCKVAPVLTRRRDEGLAALSGRIYAAGGFSHGYESDPLTSVEAYNPESNAWSAVAPLPVGLAGLAMVACDGRLFVFGGKSAEGLGSYAFSYDPAADTWTRLHDMPTTRFYNCAACVAPNGLIFVLGGGYDHYGTKRHARVDAYDRATDQWVRKADLSVCRLSPGFACLNGNLYVIGGDLQRKKNCGSIEVYNEETDS